MRHRRFGGSPDSTTWTWRSCSTASPDDGYFYRNLPHHLAAADAGEELRALLSHLAWLQTMLWATDATELIATYRILPQSDPSNTIPSTATHPTSPD
ncbi:hypothetical protein [Nocardia sp. CA-120079]|uniref:hypothetical protein n=1 Tax=Nocardia sp. CA-120079 TaxID=3239974 RepID=UPI003D98F8DC